MVRSDHTHEKEISGEGNEWRGVRQKKGGAGVKCIQAAHFDLYVENDNNESAADRTPLHLYKSQASNCRAMEAKPMCNNGGGGVNNSGFFILKS